MNDWDALEVRILDYWFGSIDDSTLLQSGSEPFTTHMQRWCSKSPAIDDDIREQFEDSYLEVTGTVRSWNEAAAKVRDSPRGSLAMTVLLDQMPRNMYRGTPRMYAHDGLTLAFTYHSIEAGHAAALSLIEQTFLYLPLMHVEDLTLQRVMEERFEELLHASDARSSHSRGYYESVLASARRHRSVIERFGRFPHRNEILGRVSTPDELAALRDEDVSF